jgi:hypothetical protein
VKYDKDEILRLLKVKADELGRFPKKREINEDDRLPSSETYRKYYGNLPQLAVAIGFPACQGKKRRAYDHDELLTKIGQLAKELGRMPTVEEIDKSSDLPCASTVLRYFGSILRLGKMLGFSSKVRYSRVYSDQELLDLLKTKADKIGKAPSTLDVKKDKGIPSIGAYKKRFGSYSEAVRLIGYKPRERREREEIPFDRFKEALLAFYEQHKRVPSANEFMSICKYYLVYVNGERAKWNQLVDLCGLPIHTGTWSMRLHRKAELFMKELLIRLGHTVVDATADSARSPYDLLMNGDISIQISASMLRKKSRLEWHFNVPRGRDFRYLVGVGYNEDFEEDAVFVFPVDNISAGEIVGIPAEEKCRYSSFRVKDLEEIDRHIR